MQNQDHYKILGVSKSASDKEIKSAYKKLARKYHPDVNPGDAKSEAKFQSINAAYEVLGDSEKRQQYDQYGAGWNQARSSAGRGRGQPFDFNFGGGGPGGMGGMGDIFEQMFGGRGASRRSRPQKGSNSKADVEISIEEAFSGTSKTLTLTSQRACPGCRGSGVGRGGTCHTCSGSGKQSQDSKIDVKIPAGVSEGAKIRVKGKGEAGPMGGPAGDLYLTIHLKKHEDYEVKGRDLYRNEKIDLFTAILGGTLEVTTLKGKVDLKIPAGTQGNSKFRLTGFGLPGSGGKKDGQLYVVVHLTTPQNLSEVQRAQFVELSHQLSEKQNAPD